MLVNISELSSRRFSELLLVAAAIALPAKAATVPLVVLLPPAEAAFWAEERAELLADPALVAARRAELGPPAVGGPRRDFVLAMLRKLQCGMVSMRAPSPDIVVNGCHWSRPRPRWSCDLS